MTSVANSRLPQLMSAREIAEETGWSRDAAKYWIRSAGLPLVRPPGTRRVYVKRDDVARALQARQT
jgi:predicted site-specific integrase-resolvase